MPHYHALLFSCPISCAALSVSQLDRIETVWDWICNLEQTARIRLDWPADTVVIAPLESDQPDQDPILGVVVAISNPEARSFDHCVALLGEMLPKDAGPSALAKLCLPLSADIQTAMLRWEIARFSARGIGLDLPPGRLYLIEGWFDGEGESAGKAEYKLHDTATEHIHYRQVVWRRGSAVQRALRMSADSLRRIPVTDENPLA